MSRENIAINEFNQRYYSLIVAFPSFLFLSVTFLF